MSQVAVPPPRIAALDLARTAALGAMVLFHTVFDLELFGYVPPGTAGGAPWRGLAVATAGSFLALAGASLWLAHGRGIRWRAFGRRFAVIAAAAGLVSGATYLAFPEAFVFFGILHAIALCSVLGLAVLSWPVIAILALAVGVFFAPDYLRSPIFDAPFWWWTGLQIVPIRTVDYEPIFPWFAPFLVGLALSKAADRWGLWRRLADRSGGRVTRALGWPGRHSLAIYLVHQPILLGLLWSYTVLSG